VTKASAGAIEYLRFSMVGGVPAAIEELKALGVWVVGLDPTGEQEIFDVELLTEPLALVFGSEGKGLSRLVRERCDVVARIPQSGSIESLNVSAAASVACFAVLRARTDRHRLTPH
jgi:23S rRNA (guanosine2251-2'-O)-methyltransferase